MSNISSGEMKITSDVTNQQDLEKKFNDFLKDKNSDALIIINLSYLNDFLAIFNDNNEARESVINKIRDTYVFNFETNISKFINMSTLLFNKLKYLIKNEFFFKFSIIIPQIFCVFPCMKKVDYQEQQEPVNINSLLETGKDVLPKFLKEYNTLNIDNYLTNSKTPKEKHQIMDLLEGDKFDIYDLAVIDNNNNNLTRNKLLDNLDNSSYINNVILRGNYIINFLFNDDDNDIRQALVYSLFNHIKKGQNVYIISLQSRNSITGLGKEIKHNIKGYDDLFILDQLGSERVTNIYTHDTKILKESVLDDNSTMDVLTGNVYEVTIFKLVINNIFLTYNYNSNINDFYKISEYNKTTYSQNTPTDKIITLIRKKVIDLTDLTANVMNTIHYIFKPKQEYVGIVLSSKHSHSGKEFCKVKFTNNNFDYLVNVYCHGRTSSSRIKFKLSYSKKNIPNFSIVNEASEKNDYRYKYLKYKNKYLQLKKMLL